MEVCYEAFYVLFVHIDMIGGDNTYRKISLHGRFRPIALTERLHTPNHESDAGIHMRITNKGFPRK